jgi:hypothetical protein
MTLLMDHAGQMKTGCVHGIKNVMRDAKRRCCAICIGHARRTSTACRGEMTSKINSTICFLTKVIQVSAIDLAVAGQERIVIKDI